MKIPVEDKPSSHNLIRMLHDIVPMLKTDGREMTRRSYNKMPKKEVENTDEGNMMDGEMSDHESLEPKLKYTTGRHAKKYETLKAKAKFYFVLHMIKNGEKLTRGSKTIHAYHMVPHFAVMHTDSKYTSSQCAWRGKTTHLFGFGAGFVAYVAGNLKLCSLCETVQVKVRANSKIEINRADEDFELPDSHAVFQKMD